MRNKKKINIKIYDANTRLKKYLGLMFKIKKVDYGMLFKNVSSVHTFFMFQKIDVIQLDNDMNVLYIYKSVLPYRIVLPKKNVKHILELPNNYINNNNINTNSKLIFKTLI